MDGTIKTREKEDPVRLEEVLAEAKRLAEKCEVLLIEHTMISVKIRDPESGWCSTKLAPGYRITYDINGSTTDKVPQVRDILAIYGEHCPIYQP